MRQRLEMVIETPRPFVDCASLSGPAAAARIPADYHGAKRRDGERVEDAAAIPMKDAEEEAAKEPIRVALAELRAACLGIRPSDNATTHAGASLDRRRTRPRARRQRPGRFDAHWAPSRPTSCAQRPRDSSTARSSASPSTPSNNSPASPDLCEARDSVALRARQGIQKKWRPDHHGDFAHPHAAAN